MEFSNTNEGKRGLKIAIDMVLLFGIPKEKKVSQDTCMILDI